MKSLATAILAAAALAVPAAAGAAKPVPPPSGGTAVVGLEQSPACLNLLLSACNSLASYWAAENTLLGAYHATPDLTYEPVLVDRADVVKHATAKKPFSVTYHIKNEAVWSDGVPVTADDFIFTYRAIVSPATNVPDRTGYSSITDAVKVDDKTVTFTFDRVFAAWKTLFSTVLPQHVLAGQDINNAYLFEIPVGDGPYQVTSWIPGQSLTLTRNPRWWGAHAPFLDSVEYRFLFDSNDEVAALASGAVDLIVPTPGLNVLPLYTNPNVSVVQTPGLFMEHLDFRVTSTTQPLLGQTWFRQAVAYAIDRAATTQALWGALSPGIQPMQSLVSWAQQQDYVPHFAAYTYDPTQVASIMSAHGCVRGADGIWSCNGVRASIGITVTSTSASRISEESLYQMQARAAGIELVPQNLPPNVIFGPFGIPGGFYESTIFGWVNGPDPSWPVGLYSCGGLSNYLGYCSQQVTSLLNASLEETNAKKRADALNAADALLAQDVPSIPLFQRPQLVAYRTTLHNIVDNASIEGPFWNLADWWEG
jgi:peptide/nickel transport system substrate-binding protein